MKSWKIIIVFVNILFVFSLYCCVPEEVILHGDISGFVTYNESSEPLDSALIELNQSESTIDTTLTGNDGSYLIKNISPGNYELEVSKSSFEKQSRNVTVESTKTSNINFETSMLPYPLISDSNLDFGLDSVTRTFTISNVGAGTLRYSLFTSQDWIGIDPDDGEVSTETDIIKVTINKTSLPEKKIEETITIVSYVGEGTTQQDEVKVLANGVADQDGNYYGVVTIGTQTWLAQNLNTGRMISPWNLDNRTSNDGVIEKYCYDNLEENCNIYGGLYSWLEMMDYSDGDTGVIGSTQGICPAGWHLPTYLEWRTMIDYLGGNSAAGGKMKDTGTLEDGTGFWKSPNEGANNESGFTALPGGNVDYFEDKLYGLGEIAAFWTTARGEEPKSGGCFFIYYNASGITPSADFDDANCVNSVRCIRDP